MHFRDGGPRGDRFTPRLKSRGMVVVTFRRRRDIPARSLAAVRIEEFAHPSLGTTRLRIAVAVRLDWGWSLIGLVRPPSRALSQFRSAVV